MVRLPIPPMIHGATQSATWMALFAGETVVLTPEFDADQVWRLIHDHKVNLLFFTGDAMARPLLDALLAHQDAGTPRPGLAVPARQHRGAVLHQSQGEVPELLPDRIITDPIGSSETGFGGTSGRQGPVAHRRPAGIDRQEHRGPDDDGNEVVPGSGVQGIIAKRGHIPVGYYKGREEDGGDLPDHQGRPLRDPRRLTPRSRPTAA